MDGVSLRLPVILTKGKILQDRSWNVRFHGGKRAGTNRAVNILQQRLCLGQNLSLYDCV